MEHRVIAGRNMEIGINLEFARTDGLQLEAALHAAAEAGYRYVEAYIYTPVEQPINSHLSVASRTPYYHLHSEQSDASKINTILASSDLLFSALDGHTSLLLPQVAVPYLQSAIDFAAECGCPLVMSDEGPLAPAWMDLEKALDVVCFTLDPIIRHAQSRDVLYAMELHNALTTRPEFLLKLLHRFGPRELGINFDTGNSFLAGNDPVAYLKRVADRVVHVHIKDIPESQVALRGTVTGTRVGVAAGDGVIDLAGVVDVLRAAEYEGVLSVECDTLEQARRSLAHLRGLVESHGQTPGDKT